LRASPLLREGLRDSRCAARQTPLHRLSDHGGGEAAAETLAALLDAGAHINVQDGRGHTPLHLAAWRGHFGLARSLVAAGASPNVPDAQGLCPLSHAGPSEAALRGGRPISAEQRRALLHAISAPPPWLPDHLAAACQICGEAFSTSLRRHHCRHCGRIACGSCSSHRLALPKFGVSKPARVCTECVVALSSPGTPPPPGTPASDAASEAPSSVASTPPGVRASAAPVPDPSSTRANPFDANAGPNPFAPGAASPVTEALAERAVVVTPPRAQGLAAAWSSPDPDTPLINPFDDDFGPPPGGVAEPEGGTNGNGNPFG